MMIIDRIEENIVVIDNDGDIEQQDIKNFALPVKEGDVVICEGGIFRTDAAATEKRREQILDKMRKMGLK